MTKPEGKLVDRNTAGLRSEEVTKFMNCDDQGQEDQPWEAVNDSVLEEGDHGPLGTLRREACKDPLRNPAGQDFNLPHVVQRIACVILREVASLNLI